MDLTWEQVKEIQETAYKMAKENPLTDKILAQAGLNIIEVEKLNPNDGMKPPGDYITQFKYIGKDQSATMDSQDKHQSPGDKDFQQSKIETSIVQEKPMASEAKK